MKIWGMVAPIFFAGATCHTNILPEIQKKYNLIENDFRIEEYEVCP